MPSARSRTIPAPVGGWNAKVPLDEMRPEYAIRMENYFPGFESVKLRAGYREHATGMGTGAVSTIAEYAGMDGTRKLIACANGKIYDATTFGDDATELDTGFTSNFWQHVNFRGKLILVNGADQPQQYDGSAVSDATYTGVTDEDLIGVHVYKERLYFIEKNSQSFWYGSVNAITGALTEYDVGGFFKKGGYLVFAGSTSRSTGTGDQDLFVAISDEGEVLVYSGTDPESDNWQLVGRYYIGRPLGRRAFFNNNSVMAIITEQGVVPLNNVIANEGFVAERDAVTDNISDAFRRAAILYSGNTGWEGIAYPRGPWILVNIPVSATISEQVVMNSLTGAWCKFTGWNAVSWALHNEKPYFGGSNGTIYQADYGNDDNGTNIRSKLKFAFNYFGDRERNKHFLQARPLLMSDAALNFLFEIDTDFNDTPVMDTISTTGTTGSMWDTAIWDVSSWDSGNLYTANWESISGVGRCGALKMEGDFQGVSFSLSAVNILFEPGGML